MASDIDIKAARELCDRATPGPWRHADDIRPRLVLYHYDADAYAENKFNPIGEAYCDVAQQSRANMRFICEARALVPALLDEVERLRAVEVDFAATEGFSLRARVEQLTRERDAAYQRGRDDLRAAIDAQPGPAIGDDPVAIAKRWNGDSGTTEPDFDMNPDDTASFLASHVIELATDRDSWRRKYEAAVRGDIYKRLLGELTANILNGDPDQDLRRVIDHASDVRKEAGL